MNGTRTLSTRWLLIGQFMAVVALALLVAGALMWHWRLPLAQEQQRLEQRRAAGVALLRVEASLELAERLLAAQAKLLRTAAPHAGPHPALQWSMATEADDGILAVFRIDHRGVVVDSVHATAAPTLTTPTVRSGYDLSNLPIVRRANGQPGLVWSDQYLSPAVGEPVVALAVPLDDGHLIAELSVDRLGNSVAGLQALEGVTLLITDSKGEVVRSPDARDRQYRRNVGHAPLIASARQQGSAYGRLELHGTAYLGHALRMDRIGWIVFAGYPLAVANATTRAAISVTLITAGAAVLAGFALMSLTASAIQRHLMHSVRYAESVAQGQYGDRPARSRITEVARLEQSLEDMAERIRQRERQLRAIIDLGPTVAIQLYEQDTRIVDWNPASERILGFTRQQALGKRPVDLYYTPEQQAQYEALLRELARTGQPYGPFEGQIRTATGELRWIYSTTFPIPGPSPDAPQFVCMDIDITALKRLEEELRVLNASLEEKVEQRTQSLRQANEELQRTLEELRRAQAHLVQADKLAALGSLVAGVAHELNTPIGNALMAVTTLRDRLRVFQQRMREGLRRSDLDSFVEQVTTAETIAERNLHRAADLVTSFKQVAVDQTSSQRREFDLDELVREILLTLQPMFKRTPYQVETDVPAGIRMDGYPGPLGQVLANLVQNALAHGLAGLPTGRILVMARTDGNTLTLTVSDNGRGIPPHLHDRIFEPFFTTRLGQGGSGLGLHIVHNIVTGLLGGRIALDSALGRGTTFRISCPLVAPRDTGTGGVFA